MKTKKTLCQFPKCILDTDFGIAHISGRSTMNAWLSKTTNGLFANSTYISLVYPVSVLFQCIALYFIRISCKPIFFRSLENRLLNFSFLLLLLFFSYSFLLSLYLCFLTENKMINISFRLCVSRMNFLFRL